MPRAVAAVVVDTQLGDVEAYDLDGSVHADTTAGLIRCDRIRRRRRRPTPAAAKFIWARSAVRCDACSAAGSIFVDSAGGDSHLPDRGRRDSGSRGAGPLTLSTEGGNIQVDRAASIGRGAHRRGRDRNFAGGRHGAGRYARRGHPSGRRRAARNCQSAAGTIRVKTCAGPLKIQTAMGSILAELLAGARIEDSSLVAGSGDITVLIPSNLALSVVARNDSGANPRIRFRFFGAAREEHSPCRPAAAGI